MERGGGEGERERRGLQIGESRVILPCNDTKAKVAARSRDDSSPSAT